MTRPRFASLDVERPVYLLGMLRIALAGFVLLGTYDAVREVSTRGYFGDSFHIPLLPEWALPSRQVYLGLLAVRALAAAAALLGVRARAGLFVASTIGLYLLCCDRLQYHNNRYLLELLTLLAAFTRCDRTFRFVGENQPNALAPGYATFLLKAQLSLVYLASGGSKLLDPEWRGGQVLHVRYTRGLEIMAERGQEVPAALQHLVSAPWFADVTSKAAIANELFLALGMWFPRTRAVALWLGVMFHFGIQVFARVEVFSFLMGAAYLLFAVPELGERRLRFDPASHGPLVRWLRRLDWLRRFEFEEVSGASLEAVDRDGEARSGRGAYVLLARTLPLLFPLWLPLALVARRPRKN
ncbi:MAG: HTTM domain-containing protein [Polyangiaceae bacterium]